MKTINIIGHSKLWLTISGAIVVAAIVALFTFGLNVGIDFTGGSVVQATMAGTDADAVRQTLEEQGFAPIVQSGQSESYLVRLPPLTEEQHQQVLEALRGINPDMREDQFTSVGPVIGSELRSDSLVAIVTMLALIALYVAWAFRKVFQPIASWKYGIVTMIAAFHDVVIPLGLFAILGKFAGFQVDVAFVAAMLTILGYSINDTIVVLDRTRENLLRRRHSDDDFALTVNKSVNETFGRSINTTLTTLLPLVAIFLIGGETTKGFALALIIGIAAGAYSSIFIASPLLVLWEKWKR